MELGFLHDDVHCKVFVIFHVVSRSNFLVTSMLAATVAFVRVIDV